MPLTDPWTNCKIEWVLRDYNVDGDPLNSEFRPTTMRRSFEFYINNMNKLNCQKFTDAVLQGKEDAQRQLLPPDEDDEDEENA